MLGLIVREPWVDMILEGNKVWEIRSRNTNVRGRIALIRSRSGRVIGTVELVNSIRMTRERLLANHDKHRMTAREVRALFQPGSAYRKPYAWVMHRPILFSRPRRYRHPSGAVIWVDLSKSA